MPDKPHLLFRNPVEGVTTYRQKVRDPGVRAEPVISTYDRLTRQFQTSINNFNRDKRQREQNRNQELQVPAHIDCILIEFYDYFDTANFENRYIGDFGLSPISYYNYNKNVLFAIADVERFDFFIEELRKFIATRDHSGEVTYNRNIKYISKFEFLSTARIIQYQQLQPLVTLKLIDNADLYANVIRPITENLTGYLDSRQINYSRNTLNNTIELIGASAAQVTEIANNFDIIQSINSYLAGVIGPDPYNLQERSFGFTIANAAEDLPVIGIIDTGISNQTPLSAVLVNTNTSDFDATGTSVFADNVNHGTGVAALAALGKSLYPNHRGTFNAVAKLLSIKVLDRNRSPLKASKVIELIRKANADHSVRLFVLTISYGDHKEYDSVISDYAYALDMLAHELDILIFISVGNNTDLLDGPDYPHQFMNANSNICTPSESMNHISVGAIADNLEDGAHLGITPDRTFPAIYTRKFHLDLENEDLSRNRKNKHLFKPDIINSGGDFDDRFDPSVYGMKFISSQTGQFFDRNIGTSYAAPLSANLAARILKQYPSLNSQTVKALIINSSKRPRMGRVFNDIPDTTIRHIVGNGIPNDSSSVFSNDDQLTIALEDSIQPEQIKCFPLRLPNYLNDLDTDRQVVEITATLCFKFRPIQNNQLAYCPIHITFGIGKNLPLEEYETVGEGEDARTVSRGINNNTTANSMVHTWAQDYYYKAKPLSNTQKISFKAYKDDLIDEDNTFKVTISSKHHKLLNVAQKADNNQENPFSLVITIKELPINGENTGRLYDEIRLINELPVVAELSADLEV